MSPPHSPHLPHAAAALLIGAGYWALASYSLALPVRSSGISYIWPADGLAVGALLCTRARAWPWYLAAVFLGNFLASNKPFALNLLYSSFNVFEPWFVAFVFTRVLGERPRLESLTAAARAILLIMAAMALAILASNSLDWLIHRGDFWKVWLIWYVSDSLGILVMAPLALAIANELPDDLAATTPWRRLEAIALVAGLIVTNHLVFTAPPDAPDGWRSLMNTPMLPATLFLFWGAIRFATVGGALCVALLALQAFWYTAGGLGPYAAMNRDPHAALLHLQATLAAIAILVILISAVATQSRRALADSLAAKKRLDRALESARVALFEVEVASGRVYLSEGWADMVGAAPGETFTTMAELRDLAHPDERDAGWKAAMEAMTGARDGYDAEQRIRRADGEWIWTLSRGRTTERDAAGRSVRMAGTILDITERKRTEQRVHYLATRDALTDLTNRALFADGLQRALEEAGRRASRAAVLSVGLDRFTAINDSLGQQAGDFVLRCVAERLTAAVGGEITVARPGGDEFLLLVPRIDSPGDAAAIAEQVLATISQPIALEGRNLVVAASVGIALFPDDGDSAGLLLRNADIALHHAKDAGGHNIQFFAESMNVAARIRMETEAAIRQGLEREEFILHYQPQIDLATGELVGYEALVRWQHPERGLLPPRDFIPIADSTGLIVALGERVLVNACRQALAWQRAGSAPVRVAVNVSARQFRDKGFAQALGKALASSGLDARLLELEITENAIMEHGADTVATLDAISALGTQLAIDDFGTGYSSLSYLKRLPVDTVKVDQSFVADLPDDADARAIVGAIIALGHNLGLMVLAEGVENESQVACLRSLGCDRAQGYFFGRPQPPELLGS